MKFKIHVSVIFAMIIVWMGFKRTSMPRKFDKNQYPQTCILFTSFQIFSFYFIDSVFVRSDGKWKNKNILHTNQWHYWVFQKLHIMVKLLLQLKVQILKLKRMHLINCFMQFNLKSDDKCR